MSKTHLLLSKETILGITLFACVVMLFFVNAFMVVVSVIDVYGTSKTIQKTSAIDDTVLSQAVEALNFSGETDAN